MGEAKRRGTYEERRKAALNRIIVTTEDALIKRLTQAHIFGYRIVLSREERALLRVATPEIRERIRRAIDIGG